jgi:hypothetical protein
MADTNGNGNDAAPAPVRQGGQVQVHFVTEEKEFELEEGKRVLLVPTGMLL